MLSYSTPLRNPLGPKQAANVEVMEVGQLAAGAFLLRTRCVTSGVPFSSNFANYVEWVAVAQGPSAVRLTVSGAWERTCVVEVADRGWSSSIHWRAVAVCSRCLPCVERPGLDVNGVGPMLRCHACAGECRFHNPVWGPIRGQILRESAKVGAAEASWLCCVLCCWRVVLVHGAAWGMEAGMV